MQSRHIQLVLSFASLGRTCHNDTPKHCKLSGRNRAQEGCRVQECTPASGAFLQKRGRHDLAYLPSGGLRGIHQNSFPPALPLAILCLLRDHTGSTNESRPGGCWYKVMEGEASTWLIRIAVNLTVATALTVFGRRGFAVRAFQQSRTPSRSNTSKHIESIKCIKYIRVI